MKTTILLALSIALCSSLLFAKDKDKEQKIELPPLPLTQEQKIELLTLQRDAAVRAVEAQPYILRMQEANERYQNKLRERMKDIDQGKWSLDGITLEFLPVPPGPHSPAATAPAVPSEKKADP
jgi:hypothetical protein